MELGAFTVGLHERMSRAHGTGWDFPSGHPPFPIPAVVPELINKSHVSVGVWKVPNGSTAPSWKIRAPSNRYPIPKLLSFCLVETLRLAIAAKWVRRIGMRLHDARLLGRGCSRWEGQRPAGDGRSGHGLCLVRDMEQPESGSKWWAQSSSHELGALSRLRSRRTQVVVSSDHHLGIRQDETAAPCFSKIGR